ncbi:MAG: glycosyl hydrolase [Acidobacteriota bacterium]
MRLTSRRFATGCLVAALASLLPFAAPAASADPAEVALAQREWRFVGPDRGGRVNAVVGHPTERLKFYAGYTGGGVWITEDGGHHWRNVSDGQITTGSIGALAISTSHPEVLYVGTGEHALRGDVSHGDGVYRSADGGETWTHVGLKETRQISRIVIHPADPNTVWVAAIGHFAGPNPERGVFRSRDGGATWQRVLFTDEQSGAIDLVIDPSRPEVLFAALWHIRRYPWGIRSAGSGSRIYRTRDGGESWEDLTLKPGLPTGEVRERIGLALSPSKPGRVWALVTSEIERGLYRSDDDGATWVKTTDDVRLFARAYYYMHLHADPVDADRIYSPGEFFFVSNDGGKTFEEIPTHHEDHHDLWVDPHDNRRMIDGSDGGAMISFNGGKSWSTLFNQPTAQIYTLSVDDQFPYRLYGAQQDWGTLSLSSRPARKNGRRAGEDEYDPLVSETGYTQVHPEDPNILFISDHHWLFRHDRRTGVNQYISPRDENYYGWGTRDIEYRFFWTFPVLLSEHAPHALYVGSQYVHRSLDEGNSWQVISSDLTLADPRTMELTPLYGRDVSVNGPYWGPITRDSNGDNWFATLYTLAESPLRPGLLWAGSDDGLIHLTRDGGGSWHHVTPKTIPEHTLISRIEPSPYHDGTAYVAATRYKLDDFRPILLRTENYGASWREITRGLPDDDFTRVIRADPVRPGLLFAGTETGVYVSLDDGEHWRRMQLNLPHVPVHDMKIKDGDLALATHGRGFWILDDLSVLRQVDADLLARPAHLFTPDPCVRFHRPGWRNVASVFYHLRSPAKQSLELVIRDAAGRRVRSVSAVLDGAGSPLPNHTGIHRFDWDLRYPGAEDLEGVATRGNRKIGPLAVPGRYSIELVVDGTRHTQSLQVLPDPRNPASRDDLQALFDLQLAIRDKVTKVNRIILDIRAIRRRIRELAVEKGLEAAGEARSHELYLFEDQLIQFDAIYRMEFHAKPIKLNDKLYILAGRVGRGEARPTEAQYALFRELAGEVDTVRARLATWKENELATFKADAGAP